MERPTEQTCPVVPESGPSRDGGCEESPSGRKRRTRLRRWLAVVLAIVLVGVALLVLNNNFSLMRTSRGGIASQLDDAAEAGVSWLSGLPRESNPALAYMMADMASLSGDQRIWRLVDDFLFRASRSTSAPVLLSARMVDGRPASGPVTRQELEQGDEYQRWIIYGTSPDHVPLTEEERAHMFSPDRYIWGKRTHQLFALLIYRRFNEDDGEVDRLINRLCEKIAREQIWDFRVTDLYLQRVAFLLAAGRPDLVRRRWVERILANQREGGGWTGTWYGCDTSLRRFHFTPQSADDHPTTQAAWVLYILKYRYPEWIEEHYPQEP